MSSAGFLINAGPSAHCPTRFYLTLLSICVEVSEVEVLQVYGAQCACEQIEVLFWEIHRAVQGALQAGWQAGVPGEEGEVG